MGLRSTPVANPEKSTFLRIAIMAAIFFAFLFERRGNQLLVPQVWDEDGTTILPSAIARGLRSLLEPVPINAYLNTSARLISGAALFISFKHYALVSTILAWAFTIAVATFISVSPTLLRGRMLIGAAALLVPSIPEVFGLPLYSFWWAGLLVFIVALWEPHSDDVVVRAACVLVGGLSSPVILVALPILVLRAALMRTRSETIVAAAASLTAAAQLHFLLRSHAKYTAIAAASLTHAAVVIPKFAGTYIAGNLMAQANVVALAGWCLVAVAGIGFAMNRRNLALPILAYLWIGTIVVSGFRNDIANLDPVLAGPRYFFFPYVLASWYLLQLAFSARQHAIRFCAIVALLAATCNAFPVFSTTTDDLDWTGSVTACSRVAGAQLFAIPVEFHGSRAKPWILFLSGDECREQLRRSLFDRYFDRS